MKRRWIVPVDVEGRVEIVIVREGNIFLQVCDERNMSKHVEVTLSEEDRLELIDALKAAGRSRAGVTQSAADQRAGRGGAG